MLALQWTLVTKTPVILPSKAMMVCTKHLLSCHYITISVVNVSDLRWCSGYTLRAYFSQEIVLIK